MAWGLERRPQNGDPLTRRTSSGAQFGGLPSLQVDTLFDCLVWLLEQIHFAAWHDHRTLRTLNRCRETLPSNFAAGA
jgi:hypothetical protein